MKPSSRTSRTPSILSDSVHQHLNKYALAATAAGVGMLALAQPAEARIVYTPAHLKIVANNGEIFFDLNHDGVNDFGFYAHTARTTSGFSGFLDVAPAQRGNAIWSVQDDDHACAAALPKGVKIGPKRPFDTNLAVMAFASSSAGGKGTAFCPWVGLTKPAYLGLKFVIKGKTHFGWARLGFTNGTTLTGYAYETMPNKPIIAGQTKGPDEISIEESDATLTMPTPEPASLGLLAMGAPGLSIWRREEPVGASQ